MLPTLRAFAFVRIPPRRSRELRVFAFVPDSRVRARFPSRQGVERRKGELFRVSRRTEREPLPPGELQAAVERWAELFNAGEYFEAHEVLEARWMHAREPEKTLLKGLIQAAVALCHYQRGNGHGARVKSASALRYLEGDDSAFGFDLRDFRSRLEHFFQPLWRLPPGSTPPPAQEWPQVSRAADGR